MHATAWLYYEEDLSQHEAAERLNVSRSTVSRLLGPARAQGIVRIEVRPPSPAGELELERLALRPGDVLAISWGSTGASLQIRAGLSIPELAEQMGHSPQMTIGTYAHVIRELKGEPVMSAEEQIERSRQATGGRLVDVDAI